MKLLIVIYRLILNDKGVLESRAEATASKTEVVLAANKAAMRDLAQLREVERIAKHK